ncbi:sulfite exporter TauE/SafE family protein [Sulfuricurvum sp.]|uniref:sulfite exporter TauE/SafE family protein n=1 Tax=Sulfuricurvum sp. TaxID=2025608 RepID=UPI0019A6B836|nr:sulfite exporter TauE/SafE family protein [Sulfuricurvum sp.]MBD3799145.1 sulfite exporter TauE/SafE family protein [Campylobacterota bacterium]MBD3806381.1 sulfite exporter TauE/SafE family protein [Sulfuricurvum sp.]
MTLELALLGVGVGTLSGFFGIGGGTVSVPILLYLGFGIKEAIGISVMQMVAGSLMAAYIHQKNQTYTISDVKYFGYGGIAGAILGGYLVKILDATILEWFFLGIVAFTLGRLALSDPAPTRPEVINRPLYTTIGGGIGVLSGMLGVGGSILMTPILVSFMGFPLKKASAVGLFFVMFTSVSAFVTLWWFEMINLQAGMVMAFSSLVGIMMGIWLLNRVKVAHYKQILVVFYVVIFAITAYTLIAG